VICHGELDDVAERLFGDAPGEGYLIATPDKTVG
jgi:hypothetical protein